MALALHIICILGLQVVVVWALVYFYHGSRGLRNDLGLWRVFQSSSLYPGPPGYPERSGQRCKIIEVVAHPEIGTDLRIMFRVRFTDGVEAIVFGEELRPA